MVVAIVLWGVAATACTAGDDAATGAASDASSSANAGSPTSEPVGESPGPPVESVEAITRNRVRLPGKLLGRRVSVAALGERGEVALTLLDPTPAGPGLRQGRLALATSADAVRAARVLPLGPRRAAPQQVTGATITRRHIVWTETPSTSLDEDPWIMYAYDRRADVTREIARAPRLGDGATPGPVPGFTTAVTYRERVAWAEVHGRSRRDARVDVLTCRIARCVPRLAIRGAAFPAITERGVLAVRLGPERRGAGGSVVLDPTVGPLRTIHRIPAGDVAVTGFTASHDTWILTQRRGDTSAQPQTTAVVSGGGEPVGIVGRAGENFGYPVLGTGFAAWAESSGVTSPLGVYVYSFATGRTYQAGNRKGLYGLKASGRHLAWQEDTTRGAADLDGNRWVTAEVVD